MKSFILNQVKSTPHRVHGYSTVTIKVHEIIDNIPHEIGTVKFCTASTRGAESEATTVILNKYPELLKENDNARHVYWHHYTDVFHLTFI